MNDMFLPTGCAISGVNPTFISFDANGNLLILRRKALLNSSMTKINNLQYTYSDGKPASAAHGTYHYAMGNPINLSQISSTSTGGYVISGSYYRTASGAPTTVNGTSGNFAAYYVGGDGSENAKKRMNWNNSKLALDIGGGIYGAMESAVKPSGQWLGKNGKYYNNSWGGNQYTGSRSGAFKAANAYKLAGRATIGVSALIGVAETVQGYQMDGDQFGYNAQSAAAQTVGSFAGGWAGAKVGAYGFGLIGGMIGGPPGAAIGLVTGGFIGGFGGVYWGGQIGTDSVDYLHSR